jgi:hypothetical protein
VWRTFSNFEINSCEPRVLGLIFLLLINNVLKTKLDGWNSWIMNQYYPRFSYLITVSLTKLQFTLHRYSDWIEQLCWIYFQGLWITTLIVLNTRRYHPKSLLTKHLLMTQFTVVTDQLLNLQVTRMHWYCLLYFNFCLFHTIYLST